MKTLIALFALLTLQSSPAAEPDPDVLIGSWDVALYFSADAPPSATVMEITAVNADGTLEGSFYQSAFETGRFRRDGESWIISVITSDTSGIYATSGRLGPDGMIEGQTLSVGRGFLMAWTAERAGP